MVEGWQALFIKEYNMHSGLSNNSPFGRMMAIIAAMLMVIGVLAVALTQQ